MYVASIMIDKEINITKFITSLNITLIGMICNSQLRRSLLQNSTNMLIIIIDTIYI